MCAGAAAVCFEGEGLGLAFGVGLGDALGETEGLGVGLGAALTTGACDAEGDATAAVEEEPPVSRGATRAATTATATAAEPPTTCLPVRPDRRPCRRRADREGAAACSTGAAEPPCPVTALRTRAGSSPGGTATSGSPLSSRSIGSRPSSIPSHTPQPRMCRANRLRHRALGVPSQAAAVSSSSAQRGAATSARTTTRETSICFFIRCTRTEACRSESPNAPARSARSSSPVSSSHHRDSSSWSSGSSQRVASATSRRCSVNPSRRMVSPAKSSAGSVIASASSRCALRSRSAARSCSRSRTCRMVMATSHDRNAAGSRSFGSPRTMRNSVSCTTSSTSA